MAYEFKKLSAVEAVETVSDTANVLIEENGVIKKAPKTEVGGAGGSGGYYIFYDSGTVTATDGIYEAILENLFTNVTGITIRAFDLTRRDVNIISEFQVSGFGYYPNEKKIDVQCSSGMTFFINENGEHNCYYD